MNLNSDSAQSDIVIVGLGPAGLGAALRFARLGSHRVVCIEAGADAHKRICSIQGGKDCSWFKPCNVVSGVAGSSLLSSGKVSEFPAGRKMARFAGSESQAQAGLHEALDVFASYVQVRKDDRQPAEIEAARASFSQHGFEYRYYPAHRFGVEDILTGVDRMVSELRAQGITVMTSTTLARLDRVDGLFHLEVDSPDGPRTLVAKTVILAMGRSGSELLENLGETFDLPKEPSSMEIGVRLEFPSRLWPEIDSCHNDLKLHFKNARTFCVCKDGWLAPYRVGNIFLMEGHSEPGRKSEFTNLAIAVRVDNESPEVLFQEMKSAFLRESHGLPIRESLNQFLGEAEAYPSSQAPATINFWRPGTTRNIFPKFVFDQIAEAVRKLSAAFLPVDQWHLVSVFGPELDFYWPRYQLGTDFNTSCPGLYLIGDGTGQFRGILQAFYSGILVADSVSEGQYA